MDGDVVDMDDFVDCFFWHKNFTDITVSDISDPGSSVNH